MSKKTFFKLVWILILQTLAMLYHLVVAPFKLVWALILLALSMLYHLVVIPFATVYTIVYKYIVEIKITINRYKY